MEGGVLWWTWDYVWLKDTGGENKVAMLYARSLTIVIMITKQFFKLKIKSNVALWKSPSFTFMKMF